MKIRNHSSREEEPAIRRGAEDYRLDVLKTGLLSYDRALDLQLDIHSKRVSGLVPDTLILTEHPPVITLGSSSKPEHVKEPYEKIMNEGIRIEKVGRGGGPTFHGPGQIVGYPIVDLRPRGCNVGRYMRAIEGALIKTLSAFNIESRRISGFPGVWTTGRSGENEKIAAIGIGIRKWVTCHGFALNVTTDISYFGKIVPCGLPMGVTSVERILGHTPHRNEIEDKIIDNLEEELAL